MLDILSEDAPESVQSGGTPNPEMQSQTSTEPKKKESFTGDIKEAFKKHGNIKRDKLKGKYNEKKRQVQGAVLKRMQGVQQKLDDKVEKMKKLVNEMEDTQQAAKGASQDIPNQ